MPAQEPMPVSPSQGTTVSVTWWVKLCRWLWPGLRYVWTTVILVIVATTIANVSTATTDTPLTKLYIIHLVQSFPLPIYSSFGLLMLLTLLSWLGSRRKDAPVAHTLSQLERTSMLGRLG